MSQEKTLYYNAQVYTVDPALPGAEAVAVSGGKILAVGAESDCRSALGTGFEEVDLKGAALLPGFIDTHFHPMLMVYFDMNLDMRGLQGMDDLKKRIRDAAAQTSEKGWIVGLQFDDQELVPPHIPTRRELDEACSERPVVLLKHDGHSVMANTAAIEAAGVNAQTPDPEGGVIDREPDGFPNGIFRESASKILVNAIPIPDMQVFADGAKKSFAKMAACGITSAGFIMQTGEEGPAGTQGAFELMLIQMLLEQIPINMFCMLVAEDVDQVLDAMKTPLNAPGKFTERTIGAVKYFSDGTYGSHTAYMFEPYADAPDKSGFLIHSEEELYRRMFAAHCAGLQVCVHAIGDRANRVCLDLFERMQKEHPRDDCRHRLEHASQMTDEIIADIVRLGVVVSTQPMFIHSEKKWLHARLGEQRVKYTYPFRMLIEAGVCVAGASDHPIESIDVLHALELCVTREGFEPQQGISIANAIKMYTINAAYAQKEEAIKGSITPGKRADMVVLSECPTEVRPDRIRHIKVLKTICGGQVIHDKLRN
jgi:predicted amidohydrolase YtcJ